MGAMITGLGKKAEIVEAWVMGAPGNLKPGDDHPLANSQVTCCGKCRQQISNLAGPSTVVHSLSLNSAHQQTTVGEFLPDAFTFRQFAPELQQNAADTVNATAPTAHEVENRLIRTGKELSQQEVFSWLKELESVDYASKTSQVVVAKLANGAYVAGVKVEEAGFNSIDPVQNAMAIANAEFGKQAGGVKEIWSFAKGRDDAELPVSAYVPLSLSGVQTLAQFAANDGIPIHLLNAKGEHKDVKLKDSARYIPTFSQPTADIGRERFIK